MNGIPRLWWLAGLFLLAGCTETRTVSAPQPGKPSSSGVTAAIAPDFTLQTLDGKELRLSDLRGKPVVVNFWASWCPPCRLEAPGLQATYKRHKEKGFTIVGVAVMDREEKTRAAVKELGLTFPIGLSNEIPRAYRVGPIPTNFFIDKEGRIVDKVVGALPEEEFEAAVKQLL